MATIKELTWKTLTKTINRIKTPNSFLKKLLFSSEELLSTEEIELSVVKDGAREIAPFVEKNSEAVLVAGTDYSFQTVQGPTIRIKRPFTPSELLFGRKPGTVIFNVGAGKQVSEVRKHIARDLRKMNNMVANTEEYLSAMCLRGQIAYTTEGGNDYTITLPRNASHNTVATVLWDDVDPATTKPLQDVKIAQRLFADADAGAPTDLILGKDASLAYDNILSQVGNNSASHFANMMEASSINTGAQATFVSKFRDDGALYKGTLSGVRMWEYARTVLVNGVNTDLIRPNYGEFVTTNNSIAQRVMYYGAISDMKVLKGGKLQAKRFTKSWEVEDPSAIMALVVSRPMPWQGHVDASVSMQLTA